MMDLILLSLFYALILYSGHRMAGSLGSETLLGHGVLSFTFGASQLLFSIQLLSLFRALRPLELFGLNVLLTLLVFGITRGRSRGITWWSGAGTMIQSARCFAQSAKSHPVLCLAALASILWATVGFVLLPNTDSYHFAMPLFWRQNESILPFAVCNPRTVGVVFASEALCFPAVLFAGSVAMFPVLAWIAVILGACIIFSLAKDCGASKLGAIAASTTYFAYSCTAGSLLCGSPDFPLSAFWLGASLYFLFRFDAEKNTQRYPLACSVLCFLLACGSKNLALLQAPVYCIALGIWCGRRLLSPRVAIELLVAGVIGLAISGVAWSYAANVVWFGSPKGHAILQATVAQDWSLGAVWTRLVRAAVSAFSDIIWIPAKLQESYRDFILGSVRVLGGMETLPEDDSYYSFTNEVLRPGRGFGWMGMFVLLPSLVFAVVRLVNARRSANRGVWRSALILTLFTIGSLFTTYVVLRTQSIGLSRLMLSSILPGVPLAGALLSRSATRLVVAGLVCGCLAAYSVLGVSSVVRHRGGELAKRLEGVVFRPDRKRGALLEFSWNDDVSVRYSVLVPVVNARNMFAPMFKRLREPVNIGVVSHTNAEEYSLFGPSYANRVVALNDCRSPDQLAPVPQEMNFIFVDADQFMEPTDLSAKFPDFEPWLEVRANGSQFYKVLRRRVP